MTWREAWGALPIRVIPSAIDDRHRLYLTAVTGDGRWALGQTVERREEDARTEPGTVVLVDTRDLSRKILHTMPTTHHQAGLADTDGRWFVWQEATGPEFADWTLFAYDRESDRLLEIARSSLGPDGKRASSSIWPQIDHGNIVWSQENFTDPQSRWGDVMSYELPNGPARILGTKTRGAAISWPYVAWAEPRPEPGNPLEIKRMDLRSGARSTVLGVVDPVYATISGESTAWIAGWRELWVEDSPGRVPRRVARADPDEGFLQFPQMSERFIAWENTARAAVFDRALDRLVLVGDRAEAGEVYGFRTKGNVLWWSMPRSKDAMTSVNDYAILDTTLLPKVGR